MKRSITALAVAVLVLGYGQQLAFAQQRQETSPKTVADEQQAQAQIRNAERKINGDKRILAQITELAKKNDRDGVQKLLILNGSPSYTQISNINYGGSAVANISLICKYTSPPLTLTCTLSL